MTGRHSTWTYRVCGSNRRRLRRRNASAGFSLIEILLVLAILVAIGAIAAPAMGEAFQRQKVQAAVQSLRGEWERARLRAMQTGQAQVFTCVPGSNEYSIQPFMTNSDAVNASSGATVMMAGSAAQIQSGNMLGAPSEEAQSSADMKTLDDEIRFIHCLVSSDMRAATVTQAQGGVSALGAISEMVLFYPDGSTSTAEVAIQNLRGDARCVRMRGLTGAAQIHVLPGVPPIDASSVPVTTQP